MSLSDIAHSMGIPLKNLRRWQWFEEPHTVPNLQDAMAFTRAADVTLDWLVGRELSPEATVATIAARALDEAEEIKARLDQLIQDLTSARAALIGRHEAELERAGAVAVKAAEDPREPIDIPRDSSGRIADI